MTVVFIGLTVGFLLGLRFKVFVLIPTILLAVILIGIGGISWSNAGQMLLTSAALQMGYLGGLIAHEPNLEQSTRRGRVGAARDCVRKDGQPHADEDEVAIADLSRCDGDHQLLIRVATHSPSPPAPTFDGA